MARALRRVALASVGALVAGILAASAALAEGPTRTIDEIHISTTFPAGTRCPFAPRERISELIPNPAGSLPLV